jgi:hypothetical protein
MTPDAEPPVAARLYINKSESRCGACNRGADPYEESHLTLTGWAAVNDTMKGCGAMFDSVSSDYVGLPGLVESIKAMRPDLPYVGWEPTDD